MSPGSGWASNFIQVAPKTAPSPVIDADAFRTPARAVDEVVVNLGERRADPIQTLRGALTETQLRLITSRDVAVIIDKSGSMDSEDCPSWLGAGPMSPFSRFVSRGEISRWQWCAEQLVSLARQTGARLRDGITIILFDSGHKVFRGASVNSIPQIFMSHRPGGGTKLAPALKFWLNDYFARKGSSSRVRPIAVAVISDGCPSDRKEVRSVLVDAANRIDRPDEIAVTFLQVGKDPEGAALLRQLDHDVMARFDIVDSRPFAQVAQIGLARALVDAIAQRIR